MPELTTRECVFPAGGPAPGGAYSPAVVVQNPSRWVFVSGQLPRDAQSGQMVGSDIATQTHAVFANLTTVLTAAGATLRDVVKVQVYLADLADFSGMDAVYRRYFPHNPPARTTIGCQIKALIEIDVVAIIQDGTAR